MAQIAAAIDKHTEVPGKTDLQGIASRRPPLSFNRP
jgi:hypothetical protein